MTFLQLISVLEKRGLRPRREGLEYRALCPAHNDQDGRPSLTIAEGERGAILVKCWSRCTPEKIVEALGLAMSDLFAGKSERHTPRQKGKEHNHQMRIVHPSIEAAGSAIAKRLRGQFTQHWTYENRDGTEAFVVLRFDQCKTLDGEKTCRPIHRDGNGYIEKGPPGPLPLNRLPELLRDARSLVFVCEGEKAANAAASIGLLATTSAHGAKSARHTDFGPLAGRDVVILPDNDGPGHKYAEEARDILLSLNPPARVRIVTLPDLPKHGDICEFIQQHDATEPEVIRRQILSFVESAKLENQPAQTTATAIRPLSTWMVNVASKPVLWVWPDRIPAAMLTLVVGIEGTGKTFVALDMAAHITTGRPWPDAQGSKNAPTVGNVIFLTSEDHLEYTIRPRLDAMEANPARIAALRGVVSPEGQVHEFFNIIEHLPALEVMIQEMGDVRLVIVDPLTAFLGTTEQQRNGEVRMALVRFSVLAEKYGCAVVGISHLSKDASRQAIHRTIGSVAFSAMPRMMWLISQDRNAGLSETTLNQAKARLGIRSEKDGIGKAKPWYWVMPQGDPNA